MRIMRIGLGSTFHGLQIGSEQQELNIVREILIIKLSRRETSTNSRTRSFSRRRNIFDVVALVAQTIPRFKILKIPVINSRIATVDPVNYRIPNQLP